MRIVFFLIFAVMKKNYFSVMKKNNRTFVSIMNQNSFSFIWMRTVPPFTSIQKVDLMLPMKFLALHVYSPESSNLAWRIMRVFFLPRSISPLVQSTSAVGTPLREQFNWRDESYVIDRFLSSGLILGRPGDGINKHNSKKMKIREKNRK